MMLNGIKLSRYFHTSLVTDIETLEYNRMIEFESVKNDDYIYKVTPKFTRRMLIRPWFTHHIDLELEYVIENDRLSLSHNLMGKNTRELNHESQLYDDEHVQIILDEFT